MITEFDCRINFSNSFVFRSPGGLYIDMIVTGVLFILSSMATASVLVSCGIAILWCSMFLCTRIVTPPPLLPCRSVR